MEQKSKKLIKVLIIVLASLLLIISFLYNILAFKTSYGTLMFKYDELKYYTMHSLATEAFDTRLLTEETKHAIKIKGENIEGCSLLEMTYYVDSDNKLNIKTICTKENETATYYFKDSTLYIDNGTSKTKELISLSDYKSLHPDYFGFMENFLFNPDLTADKENKTSMDFSFTPFYTFGIKYSYSVGGTNFMYHYSLKGKLRKVEIDQANDDYKYTIDYKADKFDLPSNVEEFVQK